MTVSFARIAVAALLVLASGNRMALASDPMPLIDFNSADAAKQVAPTKGVPPSLITVDKTGISMGFPVQPAPHSGVIVTAADGKPWNLSAYGHVEVKVTNTDNKTTLPFVMHVVNGTEGRTQELNAEAVNIPPGQTKLLTVYFGYQYGYEPSAAFNASNVTEIYLFLYDTNDSHSFRIEELKAGGVPGEKPVIDPNTLSYGPQNGVILGKGVNFDAAKQAEASGAKVSPGPDGSLAVNFTGGAQETVKIKPAIGMWDLTDANQIRVKIKNTGQTPVTPAIDFGTGQVAAKEAIAPGAEGEIIAPFTSAAATKSPSPGIATTFASDQVKEIDLVSDTTPGAKSLLVTSLVADVATDDIPDWLGKKPPVDGDWTRTFDEEFSGPVLDFKKWNIYANNRVISSSSWNHNHNANRLTHFSKDDVILENGNVILRYEKKTGANNDAEKGPQTGYSSGVLSTFGKWTQRYGYFESRMKLPRAPGLWAAFTLTPDLGKAATPPISTPVPGKAPADPRIAGVEFDVMNLISRWGTYRFSAGARENLHGNKTLASQAVYVRPDKDGYFTVGLLWTPGAAVFYNNGKEIFRWENAQVSAGQCCLRFDMAIGGPNNNRIDDAKFPADFTIDYVRAWQRKDLATPEDGPKANNGDPDEAKN